MSTLGEMVESFLLDKAGVTSPDTVKWYGMRLKNLVNFIGADRDIATITIADLRKWRAALQAKHTRYETHPTRPTINSGLSAEGFRGYVRAVRILFFWLADEGAIATSPARRFELPPCDRVPRKGIADEDMQRIIKTVTQRTKKKGKANAHNLRDRAMVLFLADTACRAGGVYNLKLTDLDLDHCKAIVTEKGLAGNGLPRAVFMEPDAVAALRAWLNARPPWPDSEYVFNGRKGRMKHSGVYQAIERVAKRAGVETGWNPHNWRHGAARAMLNNGASLAHVQQILGHTDVSTTARFYGTFSTRELQAAHDRYSWRAKTSKPRTSATRGKRKGGKP